MVICKNKSHQNKLINQKFMKLAHSCINIIASETPDVILVICVKDAELQKMELTWAEKKNYLRLLRSGLAIYSSIDCFIFCCNRAQ